MDERISATRTGTECCRINEGTCGYDLTVRIFHIRFSLGVIDGCHSFGHWLKKKKTQATSFWWVTVRELRQHCDTQRSSKWMATSWCQPLSVLLGECSRASIGIQPKKKTSRVEKILSYLKNEEKLQELVPMSPDARLFRWGTRADSRRPRSSSTYCMVRGRSHFFIFSSQILNAVIELSTFK